MKFSIRFADQIVGALVVLALAMLIVVVFMLGKNQRWFAKDYQYKSYFKSARGLSVNMNVQYKGFTIGHVKKIKLDKEKDDMVEVEFTIFNEYNDRVREGSIVGLQSSPIGLGNSFIFYPGKEKKLLNEGEVIPELTSQEAAELIKDKSVDVPVNEDSIGNIINQVTITLETVNKKLDNILTETEGAIGKINDAVGKLNPILKDKLPPVMDNAITITDQLADQKKLAEMLNSITSTLGKVNEAVSFVPTQLPQVAIILSNLQTAIVEAEKTLKALNNNPLLKGGVPEQKETGPSAATPRDLDFRRGVPEKK